MVFPPVLPLPLPQATAALGERKEPSKRIGVFTRFNVHNKQGSQPLLVYEVSTNTSSMGENWTDP